MKQKLLITVALFGALSLPYAVYADTPMELLIVTPTRFAEVSGSATVDVTVITASDIEKSSAKTLPDLLAEHAGIQVRSNDGTPDKAIDMRGFGVTGNQNTLVLLDGQPLNDIQLTSIRWSSIPLASIERIEIMNGSGAVLYGGGATGGTINIITKHPGKEMHGSAGICLGSYAAREWQLALSGSGDRVGMRVTASGLDSSNYRANNNIAQKNMEADVRTDAGHGDVALKFGADNQSLRYPGTRSTSEYLTGINTLATDPRGTSTPLDYGKSDGGHVSLGTTQQFDFGQLAGELSYRDTKQQAYFDYGINGSSYLATDLNLFSFTPRVKIPYQLGGSGNEMIVGVDLADWNYDSNRPASVWTPAAHILAKQSNRALYVQNTSQLGADTQLTLGARSQQVVYQARDTVNPAAYASGDQSRTVNAYEIGLRQKLNQDLSLFGRFGRSFRIATVDEIFAQSGGPLSDSKITILEPQTSQDSEVGIDYKNKNNKVRAAVFQMNLANEIYYNHLVGYGANVNLSPTRRYGLELEGTHNYSDALAVTAAYSYTVAKFREGIYGGINVAGDNIPLVPRQRLSLSPSWKVSERDTLSGNVNYVGKQYFDNDPANTFGQKMPAYTTVDMKLSHLEGPWLVVAAVNNLFDEKYFTYAVAGAPMSGIYSAYPMQERNFSLNATYKF